MKYTSKQVQIHRPDEDIYTKLSNFENFTPILADKVEEWKATEDRCSFKAKGFTVGLKMAEREPFKLIKVAGDDESGVPFPFTFWIQLKGESDNAAGSTPDTRMRIVLDVELNMMMRMMIGGKMQQAVDSMAERIADAFNNSQV